MCADQSRPRVQTPGPRPAKPLTLARRRSGGLARWVAIALLGGLGLQSGPAHAAAPDEQQEASQDSPGDKAPAEVAQEHFQAALTAYREGKYERAVEELEEALRLDPSGKDLVYNLGLVHEKLGNLDKALFYFRRYLEMESDPAERQRAEVIVQRLAGAQERALRAGSGGEDAPEGPGGSSDSTGPPGDGRVGKLDVWVYGTAGLSLAALTVGVIFGVRALLKHPGGSPTTGPGVSAGDLQDDAASAHDMALIADVSFGVALLSGAAASLLYFGRSAEAEPRLRTSLDAIPYGITYRGRF
ncbi:MAG: tetratricopeptide repeat protein [Myxococcales bacterium]|nr:tetratricopeptide repeat protein [Myxococcales bacterium]